MKNIYDKLEIPEPNTDLESRIIAAAVNNKRKYFFAQSAALAVCLVIAIMVLQAQPSSLVTEENILSDIDFYDDQYGFYKEIS
jgi:hypothetical protein